LLEILQNINFKSNNLFAESVYQVLLKIFNEKNESLNDYWLKRIGNNKFSVNDGSGLSRTSFLTTGFTTELLMFMYLNNDNLGDFVGTLPQLSKEGTVKDFCKDVEAKNVVRFKTGSMSRVRGFAGIVEGSEPLSFSIIFNNYQCTDTAIRTLAEGVLKEFALA
jgi:D-alanyl-D-alanine carboxypeptidase/D-alanyl-D-alanine-endopeptidase (penicillin-binding protein 4)